MARNKQRGHLVTISDSDDDVAVRVEHVSKTFILPHNKQNSIKGGLISIFNGDRSYEKQEVLKDISFEIKKGEFFGIVGRNGSGKSTLLKMLAGIYTPTEGKVIVNGSLTPFIELGVGFNPELSGRENVFLNGALLGFNRSEMTAMYDDIVEFAELERFMDQKLKNYSSGMQVRLAFSIAIRAQSDILLLDEVLAVGDESFQRKCFDYFEILKREKKTVIIVTHDMAAVERFCNKAMLINDGTIELIGIPHDIASEYSRSNNDNYLDQKGRQVGGRSHPAISTKITDKNGRNTTVFTSGDSLRILVGWEHSGVKSVGVAIFRNDGQYIFGTNTYDDGLELIEDNEIEYQVDLPLAQGAYFIKVGLFSENNLTEIDFIDYGEEFTINRNDENSRWDGVVKLHHSWKKMN